MIGIYRLPIDYVQYDTGFSESAIREAFAVLREARLAEYDEKAKTVYIPSFAATQVAPSLHPKDKRIPAIQRELDKTTHVEFKHQFLVRYREIFHLSPVDNQGASKGDGSPIGGASKGDGSPFEGGSEGHGSANIGHKPVDNQGASKGHRRGLVPDSVTEERVKRGLGGEEKGEGHRRPISKTRDYLQSWPERVAKK